MPISDYPYEVMYEGSGEGTVADGDGSSGQMRYLVEWSNLYPFLLALKGGFKRLNDSTWQYTAPERHPNISNFWCKTATWTHIGEPTVTGKSVVWEFAVVTATFGPLPFDPSSGNPTDIITEDLDFDVDTLTIPQEACYATGGDGAFFPDPVRKIIPCCCYTITIQSAPELPGGDASRILAMLGTPVNSAEFRGALPGKMMFMGVRASRSAPSFDSLGQAMYRIEYRFKYRPLEWNVRYDRQGNEKFARVGNKPLYESADLNTLLPPFEQGE